MDLKVQFQQLKEGQEQILDFLQSKQGEKNTLKVYSLNELAKFFGVTKRTIYNWKDAGKLPLTIIGSKSYMTEDQLRSFLDMYEVKALNVKTFAQKSKGPKSIFSNNYKNK